MGLTTEGKFEHKFNPVVVGLDVSALAQRAAYSNYLVGVGSSSAPNLLQLSSKGFLSSNNNSYVVFVVNNSNLGTWNSFLHLVAAFNWDHFIVFAMKYGHFAITVFSNSLQIGSNFPRGSTYNVV